MNNSHQGSAEEKFDGFLAREARKYNAPPPIVPRDAMWSAIQASRAAARPVAVTEPVHAPTTHAARNRIVYSVIGMAATLLIGVTLGRFALGPRTLPSNDTREAGAADTASTSYQVATTEHLARAEALLTAFGTSPRDEAFDAQLSTWARDVLSNTRLLIDSPASRDPSRRRLLEDLERVLVQIVQRSPTAGASDERSHIERTIQRTQMLPRLRSTQSPGVNSGT